MYLKNTSELERSIVDFRSVYVINMLCGSFNYKIVTILHLRI